MFTFLLKCLNRPIEESEKAFIELKRYLSNSLFLSPSKEGEELFLYLAVLEMEVSSALIREESRIPWPVFYTSQAFQGVEAKY